MDRLLAAGGLAAGTLTEWIAAIPGSGASLLALVAAQKACRGDRYLVVVDGHHSFYPPAAAAWGVDLRWLILIRSTTAADQQWAIDQALRVPAVGAVLAWPMAVAPRTFRRWQLAAEGSGAQGMLVRPLTARREPSWSEVRWEVTSTAATAEARQATGLKELKEHQRSEDEQAETRPEGAKGDWNIRVELLRAPGWNGNRSQNTAEVLLAPQRGDCFRQRRYVISE